MDEIHTFSQIQEQLFSIEKMLKSQRIQQKQLTDEILSFSNSFICELRHLSLVRADIVKQHSYELSKLANSQIIHGIKFCGLEYCPSFFGSNVLNHYMSMLSYVRKNTDILAKAFFNYTSQHPEKVASIAYSVFLAIFQQGWSIEEDERLIDILISFAQLQFTSKRKAFESASKTKIPKPNKNVFARTNSYTIPSSINYHNPPFSCPYQRTIIVSNLPDNDSNIDENNNEFNSNEFNNTEINHNDINNIEMDNLEMDNLEIPNEQSIDESNKNESNINESSTNHEDDSLSSMKDNTTNYSDSDNSDSDTVSDNLFSNISDNRISENFSSDNKYFTKPTISSLQGRPVRSHGQIKKSAPSFGRRLRNSILMNQSTGNIKPPLSHPDSTLKSLFPLSTFVSAYLFNCASFSYLQCALGNIVSILHSLSSLRDIRNHYLTINGITSPYNYWKIISEHAALCFGSLMKCIELLPVGVSSFFKYVRESDPKHGDEKCILLFFEGFINQALENPAILGLFPWNPGQSQWNPVGDIALVFRSKYSNILKSKSLAPLSHILNCFEAYKKIDFGRFLDVLTDSSIVHTFFISEAELLGINPHFPKEVIIT